jgi:hypothetical protein
MAAGAGLSCAGAVCAADDAASAHVSAYANSVRGIDLMGASPEVWAEGGLSA